MDSARSRVDTGEYIVASLKYERMHRFCNVCCVLGHEASTCSTRQRIFEAASTCSNDKLKEYLLQSINPRIADSVKASSEF